MIRGKFVELPIKIKDYFSSIKKLATLERCAARGVEYNASQVFALHVLAPLQPMLVGRRMDRPGIYAREKICGWAWDG